MTMYLSHMTALECWRSGRFDALLAARDAESAFGNPASPRDRACKPLASIVSSLAERGLGFVSAPVHVLVPGTIARNGCARVHCHVCTRKLPTGAFVRLAEGLYVSSPELCFVQMATQFTFFDLVQLGFELCGTYAKRPGGVTRYGRPLLLTTVSALERFLDDAGSLPGVVAARKALKHVAACSASPRETVLTMLLCLPPRLGGYGLSHPILNHRINVGRAKRAATEKDYYLCDLYWPRARLDLEYESDEYHTGSVRISEDSARRDDLAYLGISVKTMTHRQIMNPVRFDKVARQLAFALGARIRDRESSLAARRALRAAVL